MKRRCLVILCLFVLSSLAGPVAAEDAQFVAMFDGRSLDGWRVSPESATAAWSVENGVIVGQGDKGRSYLVFKRAEPSDFEMKFSYRFPGEGNSGVNIRAIPDETETRDYQSYHVDLGHIGIGDNVLGAWDFHTPGRKEHGVRRGHRLVIDENDGASVTKLDNAVSIADIHRHGWNRVHIVVVGNRYTFSINGKPSAEFTEHLPEDRRLLKGMIQLQLHDPGMVVEFKDLQLKVLK